MKKTGATFAAILCLTVIQPAAAAKSARPDAMEKKTTQQTVATADFLLTQALAAAYKNNPELEAIRAELRAIDEQYAQAAAGFRPSLSGSAGYASSSNVGNQTTRTASDPKTLSLALTQPIYSGGSTVASLSQADNTIKAERARLTATEQAVLLSAVTSYMDVLRDRQIVDLNLNNEKVLKDHLDAAREQFKLGSVTRTDVSQSEARLAAAMAARIAAQGTLKVSRAAFEKIVGAEPDGLVKPALDVAVPGTLEEALQEALGRNPQLLEAQYAAAAAHDSARAAEGALLPSVGVTGGLSRVYDPSTAPDNHVDEKSVVVQATIPLYGSGGADYSRVRQAKQTESQRRRETDSAMRAARQGAIDAWETLSAANAEYEAQDAQVRAERMAREGVKVEAQYGSRTILNYLDAEQEYLNAEVARTSSEHDKIVAAYSLLAATGRLTAADLKLDAPAYDPTRNFQNVKNKWVGTGINSAD